MAEEAECARTADKDLFVTVRFEEAARVEYGEIPPDQSGGDFDRAHRFGRGDNTGKHADLFGDAGGGVVCGGLEPRRLRQCGRRRESGG